MQKILPAILEQDPKETERKLELLKGKAEWVHIDIMDGTFVSGTTHKVEEIPEVSRNFQTEIHLMVHNPEKHLNACWQAGADRVLFHAEAQWDEKKLREGLQEHPFQEGIVLNLTTPISVLAPWKDIIDAVLLMAIQPGEQGRPFDPAALEKVEQVKSLYKDVWIGIDGGMREDNIQKMFAAKIDYATAGSCIWGAKDPLEALRKLEQMVQ